MEKFAYDLAIGKKLQTEQEPDNAVDKFAIKVVKTKETVGHLPREYSQRCIFWMQRILNKGSNWMQKKNRMSMQIINSRKQQHLTICKFVFCENNFMN